MDLDFNSHVLSQIKYQLPLSGINTPPLNIWYKTQLIRRYICLSLRCSWIFACRHCSNISIPDLPPGFRGFGKDNYNTRWEIFQFWDLARLILELLRYITHVKCHSRTYMDVDRRRLAADKNNLRIWSLSYTLIHKSWEDLIEMCRIAKNNVIKIEMSSRKHPGYRQRSYLFNHVLMRTQTTSITTHMLSIQRADWSK